MYNSNKHQQGKGKFKGNHQFNHPISSNPRISFSNDFVEINPDNTRNLLFHSEGSSAAPASSDFEFSVSNHSMMTADELFSKGKLLPFKQRSTTLREELLTEEEGCGDDDVTLSLRPPPSSFSSSSTASYKGRLKGLLGLKRAHIGSKKPQKANEESSGNNL